MAHIRWCGFLYRIALTQPTNKCPLNLSCFIIHCRQVSYRLWISVMVDLWQMSTGYYKGYKWNIRYRAQIIIYFHDCMLILAYLALVGHSASIWLIILATISPTNKSITSFLPLAWSEVPNYNNFLHILRRLFCIYLALSRRYFLCTLLCNITFKGLHFPTVSLPSLNRVSIFRFSNPKHVLNALTSSSSDFLCSSRPCLLGSGKLNSRTLQSLFFFFFFYGRLILLFWNRPICQYRPLDPRRDGCLEILSIAFLDWLNSVLKITKSIFIRLFQVI